MSTPGLYLVAWKSMRRWLRDVDGEVEVDALRGRRDLFRACAARGLIDDPDAWFDFHSARNAGAHVYQEDVAEASLAAARRFVPAVQRLLEQLYAQRT